MIYRNATAIIMFRPLELKYLLKHLHTTVSRRLLQYTNKFLGLQLKPMSTHVVTTQNLACHLVEILEILVTICLLI